MCGPRLEQTQCFLVCSPSAERAAHFWLLLALAMITRMDDLVSRATAASPPPTTEAVLPRYLASPEAQFAPRPYRRYCRDKAEKGRAIQHRMELFWTRFGPVVLVLHGGQCRRVCHDAAYVYTIGYPTKLPRRGTTHHDSVRLPSPSQPHETRRACRRVINYRIASGRGKSPLGWEGGGWYWQIDQKEYIHTRTPCAQEVQVCAESYRACMLAFCFPYILYESLCLNVEFLVY